MTSAPRAPMPGLLHGAVWMLLATKITRELILILRPSLRLSRSQPLRGIQHNPHVRRVFLCLRRKWAEGETNAGRAESGRVVLMQHLMARGAQQCGDSLAGGVSMRRANAGGAGRPGIVRSRQGRSSRCNPEGRSAVGCVASMQRLTARGARLKFLYICVGRFRYTVLGARLHPNLKNVYIFLGYYYKITQMHDGKKEKFFKNRCNLGPKIVRWT